MDQELRMMSLRNGTSILKAGAHTDINFIQFVAREAVVVSHLEINGAEVDLADPKYGLDGTELYQTELVAFAEGENVTAITFTGSISITR